MQWLTQHCQERPQARYIDALTFREVDEAVRALAPALLETMEGPSRIALWAANSEAMALGILAAISIRCEVVLLNTHLRPLEVAKQLETLGVTYLVADAARRERIAEAPEALAGYRVLSLEELTERAAILGPADPSTLAPYGYGMAPDPEQIAVIMNTSATTGRFKSVPLRWRQLEAHVAASAEVLGVTPEDNWLIALPLFHISGLSILLRSLYNGTAVTLMPNFDAETCVDLVASGTVNMLSLVPTILTRILDELPKGALRVLLLGGEYIPMPLVEACLAKEIPLYKTYGMTEATSQVATVNLLAHPDKAHTVGYPLPGVTITVRDVDAKGIGEIVIQSPTLMEGYLGQAPLGGELATGDIGYLDADGYLYILNRRHDLIISGGENIYPKEIEDLVYQVPGVRECAVVPRQDARWGQVPVLFVAGTVEPAAVEAAVVAKLARYKWPKAYYIRETLPKNASGKILRQPLIEEAAALASVEADT